MADGLNDIERAPIGRVAPGYGGGGGDMWAAAIPAIGSVLGGLLGGKGGGSSTTQLSQTSTTTVNNASNISAAISPVILSQLGSPSASPAGGSAGPINTNQPTTSNPYVGMSGTPQLPSYLPGSTSYGPSLNYPTGSGLLPTARTPVRQQLDPMLLLLLIGGVAAAALATS